MEALGLRRTVVAAAPSAATALQLVRETDLLVAVPGTISRTALDTLGLTTLALPVAMPPIPVHLMWHRRHDNDRAHRWLREQACAAVGAVLGPAGRDSFRTAVRDTVRGAVPVAVQVARERITAVPRGTHRLCDTGVRRVPWAYSARLP